jgi:ribosome modulation factor
MTMYLANPDDFLLSRIYAQGWIAGGALKSAETPNPYSSDPERHRWQTGFSDAQASGTKSAR